MKNRASVAIIGGGAAGCFAAIEVKRRCPGAEVVIYEAGARTLAKVAVTGGGRCNLSNSFESVRSLQEVYPRGAVLMKRLMHSFGPEQTREWFEREGVQLRIQDDCRVFPKSDDAMEIVRTLRSLLEAEGVQIRLNCPVNDIRDIHADRVLVTTGGAGTKLLSPLEIPIEAHCPSLFTFRTADTALHSLAGISVECVRLRIPGTNFASEAPLLLTDWGFSGPAALKLSAYAARHLAEKNYRSPLLVCWCGTDEQQCRSRLTSCAEQNPQKMVANTPLFRLPDRLWRYLTARSGLRPECRWAELGQKGYGRLAAVLCTDGQEITGRVRFKDEFVTCGGVSLKAIDPVRLCSRDYPWLFFAGEVLDIDAVTGGFNLQAAWTTAHCAAAGIADSLEETINEIVNE